MREKHHGVHNKSCCFLFAQNFRILSESNRNLSYARRQNTGHKERRTNMDTSEGVYTDLALLIINLKPP